MIYSVVIPTNRGFENSKPLLISLSKQTLLPSQVIIVLDQYHTKEELDQYINNVRSIFLKQKNVVVDIIHPLTDSFFKIGKGASYVRNYGRKQVTSPYVMFIDDDNTFDEDFIQKAFDYQGDKKFHNKRTVVVPLQYDDTTTYVRQAVADDFSFVLCRPRRLTKTLLNTTDRYCPLLLSSSNCLIGATDIFEEFPFDEKIPFVYEDLVMTGQMSKSGISIVCDTWSSVIHAHGNRSKLAELYINSPLRAYYKAKHRIYLVHTIGSLGDKILFYMIGIWGQTAWLLLHIMAYSHFKLSISLMFSLLKGTISGIKNMIFIDKY